MRKTLLVLVLLVQATFAHARTESTPPPSTDARSVGNLIDGLKQSRRSEHVMILGEGLWELGGWRYGADVAPALHALVGSMDPTQQRVTMLQALMVPLAATGCGHAVAQAMRVAPAQQNELIRMCPPTGPLFSKAKVGGVAPELLMLATVLELRAKKGGYANETLHKLAIDTLLTR